MKGWRLFYVAVVMLLLIPVAPAHGQSVPRLETAACPGGVPNGATASCYLLVTPENWQDVANGRSVKLPVMVLHSRIAEPDLPILFPTSGGPGGGSLGMATFFSQRAWLNQHDMILVEQRGTGYATPNLACPELDEALFASFGTVLAWDTERAAELTAVAACRDRLEGAGIDLTAYTTAATIRDLITLRELLGISQWHVYGVSYGTRLALQLAQADPEGVAALLLDSLYNPAVDSYEAYVPSLAATLEQLFANCAADAECGTAYPDLRTHFNALLVQANVQPLTTTIRHPQTERPFIVHLTGDDLVQGVFNAMRDVRTIPLLPFVIEQLYSGNGPALLPLAQGGFGGLFGSSRGLFYSVECTEEIPFNDMAQQQATAAAYPGLSHFLPNPVDPAACAIWPAVPDGAMNTAVTLNTPTLILAGEYDAITPPSLAQQALATLPQSYFVQFPTIGHAVLDVNQCANEIALAFLADPSTPPQKTCIAQMGSINWVTRVDVALTAAPYRIGTAVLAPPNFFWLGWLGVTLLGFVVTLALTAIAAVRRPTVHALLGLLLTLTALGFAGGMAYAFTHASRLLLGFGLPSEYSWLLGLPWLMVVLWLFYAGVTGRQWRQLDNRRGSLLLALNSLAFLVWLGWWGFFSAL